MPIGSFYYEQCSCIITNRRERNSDVEKKIKNLNKGDDKTDKSIHQHISEDKTDKNSLLKN